MYIQNTLHIVQAWIIKYHPNIGSGTVSMLPKSPNSTYISQFLRQAVPVLLRGSAREWQARAPSEERSLFALPLESTTRPKTKTEAQAPAQDLNLYIFERHLDWSPKPNASFRR